MGDFITTIIAQTIGTFGILLSLVISLLSRVLGPNW